MKTQSTSTKRLLNRALCIAFMMVSLNFITGCYQVAPTAVDPTATSIRLPKPRPPQTVVVDGSAIVARLIQSQALGFQAFTPGYTIHVGESGTRDGFAHFCQDLTDIQDAVRTMAPEEASECLRNGVNYLKITIAYDALAIIGDAPIGDCISSSELAYIYTHGNLRWSKVRPGLPDTPVKVFAPLPDTAEAQFFAEQVITTPRTVATANVQDLIASGGGVGYVALPAARKLVDRVKILAVDSGSGCTAPTEASVWDGSYSFLSRPLYIYVNRASISRSEVFRFLTFAFSTLGQQRINDAGFIAAPQRNYADAQAEIDQLTRP